MVRITSSLSLALAFACAALAAADATAQTRQEVVRWLGNDVADTDGYRIHYGDASRSYSDTLDVGIPSLVSGAYQATLTVPASDEVYISVTAYNAAAESLYSNENCKGPDGACAGDGTGEPPPPPPPPPPGVQAQILGFKLWNASTDTVIDSSFVDGDRIDPVANPCVAIEIVGNAYLDSGGAGSVMKHLDGQGTGSCTQPGITHENSPPYAWEADSGPNSFECAASLAVAGIHTLTVTPFDGDDCSGAQGTPVSVEFEVVDGSQPPPPPPEEPGIPGQPGRPYPVIQ